MSYGPFPESYVVTCDHTFTRHGLTRPCPEMLIVPQESVPDALEVPYRFGWEVTLQGKTLCRSHRTPAPKPTQYVQDPNLEPWEQQLMGGAAW